MDLLGAVEVADNPAPDTFGADDAAGLQDPRDSSFLVGHDNIEAKLLSLFHSGNIPHSLVFSGAKGIGKCTMAYRFARFLLKNGHVDTTATDMFGESVTFSTLDVEAEDSVSRLISAGAHPDFLCIERVMNKSGTKLQDIINVEEVRKIRPFARKTANNPDGWRVILIDEAEAMNRQAQNAVLKILEEPPQKTVLILVVNNMGALLPTIRSRVQIMNFSLPDENAMQEIFARSGVTMDERAVFLSEGNINKAIEYSENGASEIFDTVLTQLKQPADWEEIHTLSLQYGVSSQKPVYAIFKDSVLGIFQSVMRSKARGVETDFEQGAFLSSLSLDRIMNICDRLNEHFARTDFSNLDKRQAVLEAFFIIFNQD